MKNLKIKKGEKKDITSLYKLIKELAIYEKSEHKLIISQDSLLSDCFKEKPSYNFIVGELNNEIIGIAMYYIRYSSWKGEVLYLEDLIVTEKHRGKGFGSEIFKNLKPLQLYPAICEQVDQSSDIHIHREDFSYLSLSDIIREFKRGYYEVKLLPKQFFQLLFMNYRLKKIIISE